MRAARSHTSTHIHILIQGRKNWRFFFHFIWMNLWLFVLDFDSNAYFEILLQSQLILTTLIKCARVCINNRAQRIHIFFFLSNYGFTFIFQSIRRILLIQDVRASVKCLEQHLLITIIWMIDEKERKNITRHICANWDAMT